MQAGADRAPAAETNRVFSPAFQRELEDLFAWRRDVRRFRTDPVSEADLDAIFDAAGSAPSVGLSEPWRFVRITSASARTAVRENFEAANADALAAEPGHRAALYASLKLAGLREAPVQIAVFSDEGGDQGSGLGAATMPEMRRYSVVCAIMQMWLAARSRGLGIGWVSILDPERLRRDLDIPEDWHTVALLCLGWPEEDHLDCELERAGWEARRRTAHRIMTR